LLRPKKKRKKMNRREREKECPVKRIILPRGVAAKKGRQKTPWTPQAKGEQKKCGSKEKRGGKTEKIKSPSPSANPTKSPQTTEGG